MAVLYPRHFIGERFEMVLAKQGVPVDVAKDHGNRARTDRDAVRFLSMHNAKGLEFRCVTIGGLGELKKAEEIEDDVHLTYVAYVRAGREAGGVDRVDRRFFSEGSSFPRRDKSWFCRYAEVLFHPLPHPSPLKGEGLGIVRLTYVAITRATHEAFITYSNMSELVGRLVV